jgi:hypothetical protein
MALPATLDPAVALAGTRVVQVWIFPIADDPEAVSAAMVARRSLAAGAHLRGLRRARVIEIEGRLPAAGELAERLHQSTRFYNPNKERAIVRVSADQPAPLEAGESAALVFDRGDERRSATERWWKRVTGTTVKVREGTAWIVSAVPGQSSERLLEELLEVRDARTGLLCNPHAQDWRRAERGVPLPWFTKRRSKGRASR